MSTNLNRVIDYLNSKDCNFPLIHDCNVGRFNVFPDHRPLSFKIKTRFKCRKQDSGQAVFTFVQWNKDSANTFRQ